MGKNSEIAWTDHTFNPWWGCVKVSPGCEHCYAETLATRYGHNIWGPAKTTSRRTFGWKHWNEPFLWDKQAYADGVRRRVFCASMADVFEDHQLVEEPRLQLWALIHSTPNLDWQLLTKRPENIMRMVPKHWHDGFPDNVWIGTSVEDQKRAEERIPILMQVPAKIRWLSCEPLLGRLDLRPWLRQIWDGGPQQIHWVIIGGESGAGSRPFNLMWARILVQQCQWAGVAAFVKQLGSKPVDAASNPIKLADYKGADPDEWDESLRVRQFPQGKKELVAP